MRLREPLYWFLINQHLQNTFLILIILFLEWFYNHPALRYGGYSLICLLIFIPLSNQLEKMENLFPQVKYKFIFLICIVFIIFTVRNINRISDEVKKYDYKPLLNVFYNIDDHHYRINNNFNELKNNYQNCILKKDICNEKKYKKIIKVNGKYIFINKW